MMWIFKRPKMLLISVGYITVGIIQGMFWGFGTSLSWFILSTPWPLYAQPSLKEYRYWKNQRKIWTGSL
jgi:hypothetical protein